MFEYRKYHWCWAIDEEPSVTAGRKEKKEHADEKWKRRRLSPPESVHVQTRQQTAAPPKPTANVRLDKIVLGTSPGAVDNRHCDCGVALQPLVLLLVNSEERFPCSHLSIHSSTLDFLTYFPNWISLKQSSQVKLTVPQMWWQGKRQTLVSGFLS